MYAQKSMAPKNTWNVRCVERACKRGNEVVGDADHIWSKTLKFSLVHQRKRSNDTLSAHEVPHEGNSLREPGE